ncbi:MAG: alpha/beta hydrolase [Candidatus Thorarchaeota archaeon]|jgi:alpha/beta superfamily hydrolase
MSEKIVFVSDTFQLDGILSQGVSSNGKGALILHPHPLYGGDMYNPVVTSLEKTLLEVGYTTLRFNFRGTSFSPEGYSGVDGSVVDSRNALEIFKSRGLEQFGFVGYSYGGSSALRLATLEPSLFLITLSSSRGLHRGQL